MIIFPTPPYNPRFGEVLHPVKLQGLDPMRCYTLKEINLMPGAKPSLSAHGKTYIGDFLMKVGIPVLSASWMSSRVVEITAL